ncbi:hypothetical protein LguiB_008504 [Lonicera macranthoides]
MELPENDGVPHESAGKIIRRWDSTASAEARERMIFYSDRRKIDRYLQAVDEINLSMKSATITNEQSSAMQLAMARLEDDFYDLRSIAERMISAGFLRECVQVYGSVRKPVADASLRRLGVEKLSIGDIQRLDWDELATKILWEQIFEGLGMRVQAEVISISPSIDKVQAAEIISRLVEAVKGILSEFENAVLREHYKYVCLAHFLIMNNVHYIVQKIKGCGELRDMIGDYYLRKLNSKTREAAISYLRATWVKVLYCLRDEGLHVSGSFSSGVSKSALRERFKSFNAMLEEEPDSEIESGRHLQNYIKYLVEDLETIVLDLFKGCPASQHLRRRSE